MADYFGLPAISKRLGVNSFTVRRWHLDRSFLMYKRFHHARKVWYTNDTLIQAWEIAQSQAEREIRRQRRDAKLRVGPAVGIYASADLEAHQAAHA